MAQGPSVESFMNGWVLGKAVVRLSGKSAVLQEWERGWGDRIIRESDSPEVE